MSVARTLWLLAPLALSACIIPEWMLTIQLDRDRDGIYTDVVGAGLDCDDMDPDVHPGATEICGNGIDDDCDHRIDEPEDAIGARTWFQDEDADGFADPAKPILACAQPDHTTEVELATDCDDRNDTVFPGAPERCDDEVDNDCDGEVDELDASSTIYRDVDGDGFAAADAATLVSCTLIAGYTDQLGDCDDANASVHPGAVEIPYDGRDNACDGGDDFDLDADGSRVDPAFADSPILDATYAPSGPLDCDDRDATIRPTVAETWYDGIDQDCDGGDDYDADGDGERALAHGGTDCDDTNPNVGATRREIPYNGVDENCIPADDDDVDLDGHPGGAAGDDCDDHDPYVWDLCETCHDHDRDGHWTGCDAYDPEDHPFDCDDSQQDGWRVWDSCATCQDHDGDGRWTGCDDYVGPEDCDDSDSPRAPYVWTNCAQCVDKDGDGRYVECNLFQGATFPQDCDDTIVNAWADCSNCEDDDGDGYGRGACDTGPLDCDDTDRDMWTTCGTCVDADDDGSRTGCDAYRYLPYDCDDADPATGGQNWEVMGDGIDQDCNGLDLTVSDASGLFVADYGQDVATCGASTFPCASPGYAAPLAFAAGKVLFLAAGTYDGFETEVSVYGGYAPWTWEEDWGETVLVATSEAAISTLGSHAELRNLNATGLPNVSSSAVRMASTWSRLIGVYAEAETSAGACSVVVVDAQHASIESTVVRGGGSASQNNGVLWYASSTGGELEITETSIDLLGGSDSRTNGLTTWGGHLTAEGIDVVVSGGRDVNGLTVVQTGWTVGDFMILDSRFSVESTNSAATVTGIGVPRPADVDLRRVNVSVASGGHTIGIAHGDGTGGSSTRPMHIESSAVSSVGDFAIGVKASTSGVQGAMSIVGSTLSAEGPNGGIALSLNQVNGVAIDTILLATGSAVSGNNSISFDHVWIDSPCLWLATDNAPACGYDDTSAFAVCRDGQCGDSNGLVSGPISFATPDSWVPAAGSACIDTAADASTHYRDLLDLRRSPRPSGLGWDFGAIEQ